jgi:hypothetical protein
MMVRRNAAESRGIPAAVVSKTVRVLAMASTLFACGLHAAALLPADACAVVKKAVARRDNLPDDGPPGLGWFCDIAPSPDSRLFLVALKTSKPTPYSNLMGWYAVDRATGQLSGWDEKARRTRPFEESHR